MPDRLVSSIKPEKEIEEAPPIKYNDRTYQSYKANGFPVPDKIDMWERRFLSVVDPEKGEIERTVTKIVRLKAIDYNAKNKPFKEYLIYYEDWEGKDYDGERVSPVREHIEGMYYEQDRQKVYVDRRLDHYERSGEHPIYYIPFTKKAVDDIISASVGSDIGTIKYLIKFNDAERDDSFNYEQFSNLSFTDCYKIHAQKGGPRFAALGIEDNPPKTKHPSAP